MILIGHCQVWMRLTDALCACYVSVCVCVCVNVLVFGHCYLLFLRCELST